MGVLKDLYNIANDRMPKDIDPDDIFSDDEGKPMASYRPVSYDSIAKQAKQGIMQFPMICTRALSYDNMLMIAKAGERNFSSFLQVIFTMNQITNSDNPKDFIKQYHQNMNNNVKGPGDILSLVFNSTEVPVEVMNGLKTKLNEANFVFDSQFDMESVNEKFEPMNTKQIVMEKRHGGRGSGPLFTAPVSKGAIDAEVNIGGRDNDYSTKTTIKDETHYHQAKGYNPHQNPVKGLIPENIFVDNDVRKANELVPTLMHVRILKEMGEDSKFVDFICGVKAVIHPIDSEDIIKHLVDVLSDHGTLFKLIRWTTGELEFFRDLVFSVDKMKEDVKEIKAGSASTWWRALKNLKASRRLHKFTRTSPVLPNATLVVSMEEVDYIKANHGYDILDDKKASKILKAYNLLQLVVVDAASEIAHFFVDGDSRYSVITFKGLERQNGDADKQFKEILKAVNRLN